MTKKKTEKILEVSPVIDSRLKQLVGEAEKAEGYFITVTVLAPEGRLYHRYITESFSKLDLLPSIASIEKLVVQELKSPEVYTK